jgi:Bifunctional DNA primase/polymerase, N-terminal
MTNSTLHRALAFAEAGWPVFPCHPGQKTPATAHGYLDATTDERQITRWFTRHPQANLAIATGAPGPDVLDVDQHGPAGNGYAAFNQLRRTGLLVGATAYVATPSGGLHAYFTGTTQRNGHLPACHLDFRSRGGYILAPPSQVGGKPYQLIKTAGGHGALDWAAVTRLLQPQPRHQPDPQPQPGAEADVERLAAWVARQQQGNRNAGLYWAAHRALDTNQAADLSPLATAARHAGLEDREIGRTLDSARKTHEARPFRPGHHAPLPAHQATAGDHQAEAAI